MAECKSNQSSTQSSPLFQSVSSFNQVSDMIVPCNTPNSHSNLNNNTFYDTNDYISRDFTSTPHYNTGRLSKVTEENSNNNNSTKDTEEEELSDGNNRDTSYNLSPHTRMSVSINNNPINNIRYYTQTIDRHNNTPHTNDEDHNHTPSYERFNTSYINDTPNEFIPERIRMLLDRFAANGYIVSGAPPPANNKIIENIPEIIVDKRFIDQNDNECSICKIQIDIDQKIKILQCKHYFHSKCIVTWLHIHASCPLCRYQLHTSEKSNANSVNNDMEDAQTNRLQDLRRRRRNRRELRDDNIEQNNVASANNNNNNNNNNNISHAATQLLNAVCEILDNYTSRPNIDDVEERTQDNIDQRVVRFNIKPPPPPHSSRSNTKTRNSLPDLPLSPLTPIHQKNNSSPSHKMVNNSIDDNMNINNISSPKLMSDDSEQQQLNDNNNNNNNDDVHPISAKKIKQHFAQFMKRRSRLDSTTATNNTRTSKSPELTPEYLYSASTSLTNSVANNNNSNPNKHTIIYNSNYNQNYIYNNNYNNDNKLQSMYDDDDGKLSLNMLSSNPTTPSPSTRTKRNSNNNNNIKFPPPNTLGTEYSNITNQTFIERNSKFAINSPPFSGQNSPNITGYNNNEYDDNEYYTSFNLSSPTTTQNNDNVYSLMSSEQLEIAEKRHQNIILKQQYVIEQIQSEQNKRILNSFWKCIECKKNPKSYLFLPCRHLGLCTICNSQKLSKINKCSTCNATIRQKIPINFNDNPT